MQVNDQANELNARHSRNAHPNIAQKVSTGGEAVEMAPDDHSRLKAGGKERDGDGQILRLAAHGKVERESNDANNQVETENNEVGHSLVGCLIAGVALRRVTAGQEDGIGGEGRAGAGLPVAHPVNGEANGDDEIAMRGNHAVRDVIRRQVVLSGLNHPNHLAVGADAHAVDVELVTAGDCLDLDRQVMPARVNVNMHAIPGVRDAANAVVGQLLICGDSLPAAVVISRRGIGWVVDRRKEPVGSEIHTQAKVEGVEVARI